MKYAQTWDEKYAIMVQKMITERKLEKPEETIIQRTKWFYDWLHSVDKDQRILRKRKNDPDNKLKEPLTSGIDTATLINNDFDYHKIIHILLREHLISEDLNKKLHSEYEKTKRSKQQSVHRKNKILYNQLKFDI